MFCPACGSEYVEGIAKCSDCGAELVAELPRLGDADDGDDAEGLRMVHIAGPTEGPMIEELLNNNSIECVLQGKVTASTLPAAGELTEVRVWVRASDQAAADELIEAFFETGDASPNDEN